MTPDQVSKTVVPLMGEKARMTVRRQGRHYTRDPETFTGNLMAIGTKLGNGPKASPLCLVLNATGSGQGVPIVAIRSVVKVEPIGDEK